MAGHGEGTRRHVGGEFAAVTTAQLLDRPKEIARVAVEAGLTPATVRRYLTGKNVRTENRDAIEAALTKLDYGRVVRSPKRAEPAKLTVVP